MPVLGVIQPEAHAAVRATRNRRVGLLATEATVASGRYEALIWTLDAGVTVVPVACPKLVPLIEGDDPFGEATVAAVREAAAPLKQAGVDTVVLGCTHYPLIRPILQRVFGRDVTLVFSADETAREVSETLARKAIENDTAREGTYRFLTTGDPDAFRAMGSRFLQLPIADVEHVSVAELESVACMRHDGRRPDELRALDVLPDFLEQPHGCVLWSQGKTRVLCTATVEEDIPRWLRGKGRGWMTAEYSLLPASTGERTQRGVSRGRPDGRTVEIQRLIGRAMRAVCDFEALGERTLWLDCDVLQADGGTRCAAITGAYVAAYRALDRMGLSKALPQSVAAVSVGVVDGVAVLDLDYPEDSQADTDMNVVMTADGRLVEVQATAEREPFTRDELDELLDLAAGGIEELAVGAARRPPTCRRAREGPARVRQPAQARRAAARPAGVGDRAGRRSGASRRRPGRPTRRTRGARRVHGRGGAPPDAWVIGEDSGIEAAGLGGQAGARVGALGGRRRRAAARRAREASPTAAPGTSASSSRSGPTARRSSPRARSRERSRPARRGDEGSATTRSSCPRGRTRTVAELGDAWKTANSHRARAAAALAAALPRPLIPARSAADH